MPSDRRRGFIYSAFIVPSATVTPVYRGAVHLPLASYTLPFSNGYFLRIFLGAHGNFTFVLPLRFNIFSSSTPSFSRSPWRCVRLVFGAAVVRRPCFLVLSEPLHFASLRSVFGAEVGPSSTRRSSLVGRRSTPSSRGATIAGRWALDLRVSSVSLR